MTDIKISALPTIAQGSVGVATDSIPITQGAVTYKVTPTALVFSSIDANSTGSGSVVLSTNPVINAPTGIVKADVGLSNVDNTSDATKNAAVATLTNKTLTSPVINAPTGIVKADVGLGNVDNTSDATKNAAVATLTNKTLANPSYSGATANAGTVTTIDINGGTVDGAVIGGAVPAAGSFTTLNVSATATSTGGDLALVYESRNTSASNAQQFVVKHDLGGVILGSARSSTQVIASNAVVGTFSSTGLSVTGGISATGVVVGSGINAYAFGAKFASAVAAGSAGLGSRAALVDFGVGGGIFTNWYYEGVLDKRGISGFSPRVLCNSTDGTIGFDVTASGSANTTIVWNRAATLDASGLAVTGAISASGNVVAGFNGDGALSTKRNDNTSAVLAAINITRGSGAGTAFNISTIGDGANGVSNLLIRKDGASIGDFSATGLSVTGVLDVRTATGAIVIAGRTSNVGAASEPGNYEVRAPNASGNSRIWTQLRSIVGTATEGAEASSLLFSTQGAGALVERMRLDASGNLGIGTTAQTVKLEIGTRALGSQDPSYKLIVNRGITGQYAEFAATNGAANINGVNGSGGAIFFLGDGVERARIDASGNLGLGVVPSAWRASADKTLQVNGTALTGYGNYASTISNNAYFNASSSWRYIESGVQPSKFDLMNGGGFAWYTAPSGTAGNPITFTQAMTLDASGNLGLGVAPVSSSGKSLKTGRALFGSLPNGPYPHSYMSANCYPTGSADPGLAVWKYESGAVGDLGSALLYEQNTSRHLWKTASPGLAGATVTFLQAMSLDSSGNLVTPGSHTVGSYTMATRPGHAAGKMIYVSDGGAGANFQGSNGSTWVNLG